METCVRYCSFFENHPQLIPTTLEHFVRFVHSDHPKVRTRSWYLFHRFVRHLRAQLGNVAQDVIDAISDLLPIRAEIPQKDEDGDMSSDESEQKADAVFEAQLYLFEAIGRIASTASVPVQNQVLYARSIIDPLFTDMERHLVLAKSGDERAVLQIHHDIMALGTLARGYSEWTPGIATGSPPPNPVSEEFIKAEEAILASLEVLKFSLDIRTAARAAFSRLVGVLGARILNQLPRWIDGLLSQTANKDEMATFLRLLDQVVFGFKASVSSILDSLLTPLLNRVFAALSVEPEGTDEAIQTAELRREYLNFLLVILDNDLSSVFISTNNQSVFETIISTIEHFTKDPTDLPTAKLAFATLSKFCNTWGGPDITNPSTNSQVPQPSIPGFDRFMISRISLSRGHYLPTLPLAAKIRRPVKCLEISPECSKPSLRRLDRSIYHG